ncbi:MAG TPA: imidazole glycerol phosphate synthase subunit HisH [Chloroflexota bacterium]|jgi:glutamine amidotransferase
MIVVVDYGLGNLRSVAKALEAAGGDVRVSGDAADVRQAERIVLPGQGAFPDCMAQLDASGLREALADEVQAKGKPFLGICLGLQVLAADSDEGGLHAGLGWYPAHVRRLRPADPALKLPHIGWNEITFDVTTPLARGLKQAPIVYFDHSYQLEAEQPELVAARCDYGGSFCAALQRDNVFATQFHPEKSQDVGLRVLRNFLAWNP